MEKKKSSLFAEMMKKKFDDGNFAFLSIVIGIPAFVLFIRAMLHIPHNELSGATKFFGGVTLVEDFVLTMFFFVFLVPFVHSLIQFSSLDEKDKKKDSYQHMNELIIAMIGFSLPLLPQYFVFSRLQNGIGFSLTLIFAVLTFVIPLTVNELSYPMAKRMFKEKKQKNIAKAVKEEIDLPFDKDELNKSLNKLQVVVNGFQEEVKQSSLDILSKLSSLVNSNEKLSFESKHIIIRMINEEIPTLLYAYKEINEIHQEKFKHELINRLTKISKHLEFELEVVGDKNLQKLQKVIQVIDTRYDKDRSY